MGRQDEKYILLLFNNATLLNHIIITSFHFYLIFIDMLYVLQYLNPLANYIVLFLPNRLAFSFFVFVNGYRLTHTCFKKLRLEQCNIQNFLKIYSKIFSKNLLNYYACLLLFHFVYKYLNIYPENESILNECESNLFYKFSFLSKIFGNSRLCQGMFWTYALVMQFMLLFPVIIIGIKWYV